jgi:hypothetical protein
MSSVARAIALGMVVVAQCAATLRAECPTLSLDDQFKQSTAVFIGRAVAQSVIETGTSFRSRVTDTTFEIERLWKGDGRKDVTVRVCGGVLGDTDLSCGESVRFSVGSRYIVFADGEPLQTNTCHHTTAIDDANASDEAKATLRWLATKPPKQFQR